MEEIYNKFKRMILIGGALIFFMIPQLTSAQKIGWITDIHADNMKKRTQEKWNVIYPNRYYSFFKKALADMKNQGISTVIITGDSTNSGKMKYAKKLKKVADASQMKILWAKGNHDDAEEVIYLNGRNELDFYYEDETWRFVVLNSSEDKKMSAGSISQTQIEWLDAILSQDSKPTVIAMHHPIFFEFTSQVHPNYANFEKVLSKYSNIRLVLFGHWHLEQSFDYNGSAYKIGDPLTTDRNNPSYYVLDLDQYLLP